MADWTITMERGAGCVTFRVTGAFDRNAAWELREQLKSEAEVETVIDFSLVRDFSDLGVAVLAHALAGTERHVALRGLQQHQVSIFRYCGVPVEEHSGLGAASPVR
jgi:anti-anti-sigma regulatory factor